MTLLIILMMNPKRQKDKNTKTKKGVFFYDQDCYYFDYDCDVEYQTTKSQLLKVKNCFLNLTWLAGLFCSTAGDSGSLL